MVTSFKHLVPLALVAVLGAGCAGQIQADFQASLADLSAFAGKDIDAALARAARATDVGSPYRARCYATLKKYLPQPGQEAQEPPVGLVDAFELAAEVDAKLQAGGPLLPPELEADCSYVIARIRKFVLRNAAKLAPVPGVGAASGLLR